jgi:hypothetical protein
MSMTKSKVFFAALLAVCWSCCAVRGQELTPPSAVPLPVPKEDAAAPKTEPADQGGTGLSSWITYDRNNCCIGKGGGMPVLTEVVFRIGPSLPVGGEYFGRNLDTGWMIEGGARAMFFNQAWSAAWTVELTVSNTYNPSHSTDTILLAHDIKQLVSVRALDRTFGNAGFGREWYLWSAGNANDRHWRCGADVGGRYGAATVKFNEIRHRTQVIEGVYAALHTDLEIPWGRCTYFAGLRGEYGFTWSNIFAPGQGDMQDLTVLFNLGVRY